MLVSKPKLTYNGLTVVLSNPSRHDKNDLLTGTGGWFFNERCLRPHYNRHQVEVRLAEDRSELLPNTRCILLLGEGSLKAWQPSIENSLNEVRGSILDYNGIPTIASYFPQDCVDLQDYEGRHNAAQGIVDYDDDDDDKDAAEDKRRHGHTKRKNFGFWLTKDIERVKFILKNGVPERPKPEYIIYPDSSEIIRLLKETKNEYLYFDIETDRALNIICFSFSFGISKIYVVPCLLPDYSWAYSSLPHIFRALAIAIRDNILVCHNGCNFDYFVLAYKYHIPIYRVYDTMVAGHRCYPEQEKSLGHYTSLFTWEPFHKDEGDVSYNSLTNARALWQYCGKDVYTMALIREAIDKHAARNPGLADSIKQANESIKPYLIMSLMGIHYKAEKAAALVAYNDRMMNQMLRWLNILVGESNLKAIRGKGKSAMPTSNKQCCEYFHNLLGYPIVAKGKERKDGTQGPSLGKKAIFKLRLQVNNPVLDIVIAYRETQKESSTLGFTPWKAQDEKVS